MSYKGKFKPKNYQKYKGNPTNITYRSLLERRFMVSVMKLLLYLSGLLKKLLCLMCLLLTIDITDTLLISG